MPLTPEFSIVQDDNYLYFTINCPNVRARDMDLFVADMDFNFSADPYLLILHFQHPLRDGEGCTASYDIETGIFKATIKKANPGEDFPEIYLFTTLKKVPTDTKPKIELVDRTTTLEYIDEAPDISNYGFNFWAKDFFKNMNEILPYVTDIPDPDNTILPDRTKLRILKEDADYDPDQVMNDFIYPFQTEIEELKIFYEDFNPSERKKLLEIKRQEFLMSKEVARSSFLSIAEVIYSSVMDVICFGAEGSCESNWTIAKLSATLSWFDAFNDPKQLIITTVRRTLAYCVSRSFSLAKTCWDETVKLMKSGRTGILKALIRAKAAVERAEHRWRLNRLYIDPMISWIQELSIDDFNEFSAELFTAVDTFITKDEVSLPSFDWCVQLLENYAVKMKNKGEIIELPEISDEEIAKKYV